MAGEAIAELEKEYPSAVRIVEYRSTFFREKYLVFYPAGTLKVSRKRGFKEAIRIISRRFGYGR